MTKKKPARVPPVTTDRLLRGWTAPGGTWMWPAAPGDEPAVEQVIAAGTVGSTLLTGYGTAHRRCRARSQPGRRSDA